MTLTTAVSNQYRTVTDRALDVDWARLAAIYLAVHLAAALWFVYVDLLSFAGGTGEALTLTFGVESAADAAAEGLILGAVIAPVLLAVLAVLSRVFPIRRLYAQTIGLWVLIGPAAIATFFAFSAYDRGLEYETSVLEISPWQFVEAIGMWIVLSALLAAFVGGAYALSTGSARPSRRTQRALVVLVVVLVALPAAVGAVAPVDESDKWVTSNEQEVDGSDELEESYEPVDDQDSDDETDEHADERISEEDWYGGSPTDPETYNNGEHSPKIEHATALEGESDAVTATAVNESDLPSENESVGYPLADVHTDAEGVTVSDIESEVNGETVRPEARYHVAIEGVDETHTRQLGIGSIWAYDSVALEGSAQTFVTSGPYVGLEDGFYVDMERVESTHVYFDVVTEDGELERHIVKLERAGE